MNRLARVAPLLLATIVGCGARTGLRTPDVPTDTPPVDAASPRPPETCIELPADAGVTTVDLDTRPQVSVADVFFLIDRTGSMDGEIDNIKANLQRTIVPAIARAIDDVQFGVATYADFPLQAPNGNDYGDPTDIPFTLVSPIDRGIANVQGAVNGIVTGGGGDNPEAMTEALYQIATGAGYLPWITPRVACPVPGRLGYGCLRPNAQTILVLVSDAPSHNGPLNLNAYNPSSFTAPASCPPGRPACAAATPPHVYADAITALRALNARVIGISSGVPPFSGRDDMRRLAIDTGSVTAAGNPLVFDIGSDGRDLDTRVVSAVETFTQQVRFNASARIVDLDPAHPASQFVLAVRPASASPMSNIERLDATTFYGVVPGTRLTFALDLQNRLPRMATAQRFPARVQFFGDGRANLGSQDIVIVIPGDDGAGCNAAAPGLSDAGLSD
jgi:hypothetical protein